LPRKSTDAVLFSCVAENRQDFATMAQSLAISIRGFGGSVSDSPIVVNFVDGVREEFADSLHALGVEVRVVDRVAGSNPLANKLRMLELHEDHEFDVLVALDCDVVVLGDPSVWIDANAIGAKAADFDRFTDDEWRWLFGGVGITEPAKVLTATATGGKTYPYFNSGVLFVPSEMCGMLRDGWMETYGLVSQLLADDPTAIREQWQWLAEQASLALAILRGGLPWYALPAELNFPAHVVVQSDAMRLRPVIVHYHGERDEHGFLMASPTPQLNAWLDGFNRRRAAVTGQPYTALPRRSLYERLRRSASQWLADLVGERRWYRSRPVRRVRKGIKRAVGQIRQAW
jgi:hypothetical protein